MLSCEIYGISLQISWLILLGNIILMDWICHMMSFTTMSYRDSSQQTRTLPLSRGSRRRGRGWGYCHNNMNLNLIIISKIILEHSYYAKLGQGHWICWYLFPPIEIKQLDIGISGRGNRIGHICLHVCLWVGLCDRWPRPFSSDYFSRV